MGTAKSLFYFLLLASFSTQALADETYTICIGEFRDSCPTAIDVWFSCGTSANQAAESVCTVSTKASQTIGAFSIAKLSDRPGNHCGYATFRITCKK